MEGSQTYSPNKKQVYRQHKGKSCPSFMKSLRYLGPHQYNNILQTNENVP